MTEDAEGQGQQVQEIVGGHLVHQGEAETKTNVLGAEAETGDVGGQDLEAARGDVIDQDPVVEDDPWTGEIII